MRCCRYGVDTSGRLRSGDLVVIDESAMTDTAALAAVHARVEQAGASLLLVGDHKQLAAVGAGGGMELVSAAGVSYELTEARRFTHDWERAASLRLRDGDPTVLAEYHRQGRLLDCGTVEQAEQSATNAWLADTLAGKQSLLLVDTNAQAARLSAQIRAELVRLGQVSEDGVELAQGTYAGVGDVVQARRNGWGGPDRRRGQHAPADQPRDLPGHRSPRGRRHGVLALSSPTTTRRPSCRADPSSRAGPGLPPSAAGGCTRPDPVTTIDTSPGCTTTLWRRSAWRSSPASPHIPATDPTAHAYLETVVWPEILESVTSCGAEIGMPADEAEHLRRLVTPGDPSYVLDDPGHFVVHPALLVTGRRAAAG